MTKIDQKNHRLCKEKTQIWSIIQRGIETCRFLKSLTAILRMKSLWAQFTDAIFQRGAAAAVSAIFTPLVHLEMAIGQALWTWPKVASLPHTSLPKKLLSFPPLQAMHHSLSDITTIRSYCPLALLRFNMVQSVWRKKKAAGTDQSSSSSMWQTDPFGLFRTSVLNLWSSSLTTATKKSSSEFQFH